MRIKTYLMAIFIIVTLSLGNNAQAEEKKMASGDHNGDVKEHVETNIKDGKPVKEPQTIVELRATLNELLTYYGVAGMSVTIVEKDHFQLVAGIGMADREREKPASAETLFRIGSVSKMFVALSALKLIEEGKLSLNEPIKNLAPEVLFDNPWESTDPVRLVHLLEHTAGWDDIHLAEYAHNTDDPIALKDALAYHPHSRTSRWKPGDRMSYSNSGPAVVAYIIEKITNQTFENYVQQHFFDALEMRSATYFKPKNETLLTTLYQQNAPADYWNIIFRASGSINASATDMAQLVQFFVNRGVSNGVRLLETQSIERMEQPKSSLASRAGLKVGYGLYNTTSFFKQFIFQGHNGGVNGGLSDLSYLPDHGIGFFLSINSDNGEALNSISNTIKTFITRGLTVPKALKKNQVSQAIQDKFSGYYKVTNPRQELTRFASELFDLYYVQVDDDGLSLNAVGSETVRYNSITDHLFQYEERTQANLILIEDSDDVAFQKNNQYFQKVSYASVLLKKGMTWLFLILLLVHFIWFFVWLIRWIMNLIPKGAAMTVRLWPAIFTFSIGLSLIFIAVGQVADLFGLLGRASIVSVSIYVLSMSLTISSSAGLYSSLRHINAEINPFAKWFCLLSNSVFFIAMLYLLSYGVIGLKTFG